MGADLCFCLLSRKLKPRLSFFLNFNSSNSIDINRFQIKPIKFVIDLFALLITCIYIKVTETGTFLKKKMKHAKITVLHKGGDESN